MIPLKQSGLSAEGHGADGECMAKGDLGELREFSRQLDQSWVYAPGQYWQSGLRRWLDAHEGAAPKNGRA